MNQLLLTINVFSTFFMCGLIWIIQLVHYPTFLFVERDRYTEFQRFHMFRISWIVLPVMSMELLSGAFLWYQQQSLIWTVNLFLLSLIWFSTLAIQSPSHAKLEKGFDQKLVSLLIRGNWIRTILWTLRALILVTYLIQPTVNGS
jgi:hypothetical protein